MASKTHDPAEIRPRELPEPDLTDPDNPELTEADFAKMRPAHEVLSPETMAQFPKSKGGRPRLARPKRAVNLRLDAEVVDHLRGQDPGWQTRVNETLAAAIKAGRL
jgi:uncharacterized protein (DUF4415 family)